MKKTTFCLLIILLTLAGNAQTHHQTIRGRITERETLNPVPFATIALLNGENLMGAVSDENGEFRIEKVPVGRITLRISSVGYETMTIANLDVNTAHETLINAELITSIVQLNDVEISAQAEKEKPLNMYALSSARVFSVEESQRYAGASNDVSRMAMNFAGVKATNDTQNEIVIRGNSPVGLLFRLDGIDIPNPNHFSDGATSGGVISMLNNNVLTNSDFITGAFPAEYANTLSGVFDLKMRSGNNQQHQFLAQASLMGSELGAEGPISKSHGSSYLVNYRYSTVELLNAVIDLKMGAMLPSYQDACFKLNFPHKNNSSTSLVGFGGRSIIAMLDTGRDTTQLKPDMTDIYNYETDEYMDNYTGALGIIHTRVLGSNGYLRATLSATSLANSYQTDSLSTLNRQPFTRSVLTSERNKFTARLLYNRKINNLNTLRAGFSLERWDVILADSIYNPEGENYHRLKDFSGDDYFIQPYAQWHSRLGETIRFTAGVNSLWQATSGKFSVEPRAAIEWEPIQNHHFNVAYGLHSMATAVDILQHRVTAKDGTYGLHNQNLGFTKSQHFVLGYHRVLSEKWRFKSELYYQYITEAVTEKQESSFSLLNRGSSSFYNYFNFGELTNGGKGLNYGLELTAEKFMDKGNYLLTTFSLYESKYRGSDGILRNTAHNGNYVFNLLAGHEFRVGSPGKFLKRINVDGKFNLAGGQRFSPIDLEASRAIGFTQYDETRAWQDQMKPYMSIALRVGFKISAKAVNHEIAINITNLTNRQNPFFNKYDRHTDQIVTVSQFGIMPDILYRISF